MRKKAKSFLKHAALPFIYELFLENNHETEGENYFKKLRLLLKRGNSLKLCLRLSGERSITAVRRCLSEQFLQINHSIVGGKFSEEVANS